MRLPPDSMRFRVSPRGQRPGRRSFAPGIAHDMKALTRRHPLSVRFPQWWFRRQNPPILKHSVRMMSHHAAAGLNKYLRVLRYARPGWRAWIFIAALMLVSSSLALLQPWPMKVVL